MASAFEVAVAARHEEAALSAEMTVLDIGRDYWQRQLRAAQMGRGEHSTAFCRVQLRRLSVAWDNMVRGEDL